MAAGGFDIEGVDDEAARETLRAVLDSQGFSGIRVPVTPDCDPLWDRLTDLPTFDRELKKDGVEMVWAEVCVTPLSWVRLQAGASAAAPREETAEGFLKEPLMREEALAAMVAETRDASRVLPHPLLELDRNGHIRPFQEGRTRGVAAYYADVDRMPAYVFLNPTKDDGAADVSGAIPTEFELQAFLDANAPPEGFREEVVREARRAVIRRQSRADDLAGALREETGEDVSVTVFGSATPEGDPRIALDFKWAGSPVSSSIELDRDGRVKDAIVRYPELDVGDPMGWRKMKQVEERLAEAYPTFDFISVYVGGRDNTRPHVQFFGLLAMPDTVTDFLADAEDAIGDEFDAGGEAADISSAIRDALERWDTDPCAINMGLCEKFAETVEDRVPEARIVSNLEMAAQEGEGPEHVWLVLAGRHYDSETPEGVGDWRDLPFFQRHFTAGEMAGWELGEGIEKSQLVRSE